MTENQPNTSVEAPAKATAKKFLVFNSLKTATAHNIAITKKIIANSIILRPPCESPEPKN